MQKTFNTAISDNLRLVRTVVIGFLISCSFSVLALDNTDKKRTQAPELKQSFLSCSIITSEHLTALQLYQRGLPKKLAIESLPSISRDGKKRLEYVYEWAKKIGILNAYADINTNYARCSTLVYEQNGRPAADLKEHAYYFCAGENKIRFEIILKLDKKMSMGEITNKLPSRYTQVTERYKRLINDKGMLAAFDLTANNLKACLQQIE
tara:strand:+ start:21433 stop:22056 length:624 start_codon:yes stop_codon:yes gene_type:complete